MSKISLRVYQQKIRQWLASGELDQAVLHCRHILNSYPKDVITYRLLGKALITAQNNSEAGDVYQRILSVYPDDLESNIAMAGVHENENRLNEAIASLELAYEIQPSNPTVQEDLKRMYGRRDGSVPVRIRLSRGGLVRMYLRGGLNLQALAEIKAALVENPDRYDLQVLQAELNYRQNQKVEATEICGLVLRKLPYCYEANRLLHEIFSGIQKNDEAQQYLEKLTELDPYYGGLGTRFKTPADVPDDFVTLESLDIQPQTQPEEAPEWTKIAEQTEGEEISGKDLSPLKEPDLALPQVEKPEEELQETENKTKSPFAEISSESIPTNYQIIEAEEEQPLPPPLIIEDFEPGPILPVFKEPGVLSAVHEIEHIQESSEQPAWTDLEELDEFPVNQNIAEIPEVPEVAELADISEILLVAEDIQTSTDLNVQLSPESETTEQTPELNTGTPEIVSDLNLDEPIQKETNVEELTELPRFDAESKPEQVEETIVSEAPTAETIIEEKPPEIETVSIEEQEVISYLEKTISLAQEPVVDDLTHVIENEAEVIGNQQPEEILVEETSTISVDDVSKEEFENIPIIEEKAEVIVSVPELTDSGEEFEEQTDLDILPDWILSMANQPEIPQAGSIAKDEDEEQIPSTDMGSPILDEKLSIVTSVVEPIQPRKKIPPEWLEGYAWLETLAAAQGADERYLLLSPEKRRINPPEWVKPLRGNLDDTKPVRIIEKEESPPLTEEFPSDWDNIVFQAEREEETERELPAERINPAGEWVRVAENLDEPPINEEITSDSDFEKAVFDLENENRKTYPFEKETSVTELESIKKESDRLIEKSEENIPLNWAIEGDELKESMPPPEMIDEDEEEREISVPSEIYRAEKTEAELLEDDNPWNRMDIIQKALVEGRMEEAAKFAESVLDYEDCLEEICAMLHRAVSIYPQESSLWQVLGDAYARQDKLEQALEAYSKAENLLL